MLFPKNFFAALSPLVDFNESPSCVARDRFPRLVRKYGSIAFCVLVHQPGSGRLCFVELMQQVVKRL